MKQPELPYPSDTLVHHVASGDLIGVLTGNLERWGQWGTGGDLSACHVEGFYDLVTIAKMNPKESCLYVANQAPWDNITASRLMLGAFARFGVPMWPGTDPNFKLNFQHEIEKNLGQPYAWGQIMRFSFIGLLARIWPSKAQDYLKSTNDAHAKVCSQWWTARIENAVKQTYGALDPSLANFDLFEGTNVGDGEERPADYVKSKYLVPLA